MGAFPALPLLAAQTTPNLVVFLVDDMGVMDTSVPFLTDPEGKPRAYPLNRFYRTPQMERLAAQGIRFNQFCAMSVCSPTRVSLLTGQNAARHHTTNWINPHQNNGGKNSPPDWNWLGLGSNSVTLPRILQQSGYRTIHVGKGHFGPEGTPGSNPVHLGFDVNVAGSGNGHPASYFGKDNFGGAGKKASTHAVHGLEKYHGTDTFLTDALTAEAKAHVSQAVENHKPFFLYLAHYAVHSPFQSDPRFAPNYKDSGRPASAQAFATLIEGMDKSLGDLLDHLESLKVAGDTLVLFLGDNGSDAPHGHEHAVACAEPLRGRKGSHYEGGMRVPFIAAWARPEPGNPLQRQIPIPAGTIQSQQAAVYDIFPTLLKAAGIPAPAAHPLDGSPLQTLLSGAADPTRRESFLMHYPHTPHRSSHFTAYRENDWKVVYHYFPGPQSDNSPYQLFHLASDPFEQHNLASERPEDLRRMMLALAKSLEAQHAQYPVTETGPLKPWIP